MGNLEEFKKRCKYVSELAELIGNEVVYWTKKLSSEPRLQDEIAIRERVFNLINTYMGLFMVPEGLASQLLATTAYDSNEKEIVKNTIETLGKKYIKLSRKYRETLTQ